MKGASGAGGVLHRRNPLAHRAKGHPLGWIRACDKGKRRRAAVACPHGTNQRDGLLPRTRCGAEETQGDRRPDRRRHIAGDGLAPQQGDADREGPAGHQRRRHGPLPRRLQDLRHRGEGTHRTLHRSRKPDGLLAKPSRRMAGGLTHFAHLSRSHCARSATSRW
jgi:hypothetical protein